MKIKHNKKRNTAFLYEVLVQEVTRSVINQDDLTKNIILGILKEFFNSKTILNQELKLYKSILKTKNITKETSERILREAIRQHSFLDKQKIFADQSRLIKKVNKSLSHDVYNNHLPDYKCYATLFQVFNEDIEPKIRVMMENEVIDYMRGADGNKLRDQKPIDKLVFKTYLDKFNQYFSKQLNESQRTTIAQYVNSINDNGLEFKLYLNEEVKRLHKELNSLGSKTELSSEIKEVISLVEQIQSKPFELKNLQKILQIQKLVEDLKKQCLTK